MTGAIRLLLGAIAVLAPAAVRAEGDAARGQQKFEECIACHSTERGQNGVGPSLYGVLGRKAGELADFRYSPAVKRSGITWSEQTIDAFVTDPQKMIPANRMPYAGMPDANDRADLIAYLAKTFR
jgi:cytochrome c2